MKCECEQEMCHGLGDCGREAEEAVRTVMGTFNMCTECKENMPAKYLKKTGLGYGDQEGGQ